MVRPTIVEKPGASEGAQGQQEVESPSAVDGEWVQVTGRKQNRKSGQSNGVHDSVEAQDKAHDVVSSIVTSDGAGIPLNPILLFLEH